MGAVAEDGSGGRGAILRPPRRPTAVAYPDPLSRARSSRLSTLPVDERMVHFVTPKGAAQDEVTITASLTPDEQGLEDRIDWEGATEDPEDPLQATVPKDAAARHVVSIKLDDTVMKEFRVWVVWCSGSLMGPTSTDTDVAETSTTVQPEDWYLFTFTIQPATIITDGSRPRLSGGYHVAPPDVPPEQDAAWHYGADLSAGADKVWDESRRVRIKLINDDEIAFAGAPYICGHCGMLVWADWPEWPQTAQVPAVGNDDPTTGDEDNDPYDATAPGALTGADLPQLIISHEDGSDGDSVELRLYYQEFARIELGYAWHVISDPLPWRVHVRLTKVEGKWVDDGSSTAADNGGWEDE